MIGFVQRIEAAQTLEVNSEYRFVTCQRIDVADNAGTSTIGDEVRTNFARVADEVTHLALTFRIGDPVREAVDTATTKSNPIRQALPPRMAYPFQGIVRNEWVRR